MVVTVDCAAGGRSVLSRVVVTIRPAENTTATGDGEIETKTTSPVTSVSSDSKTWRKPVYSDLFNTKF